MAFSTDQLRTAMRALGPASASALARHLDVSTPTATAAIARLGDEVLATGRGRASRYALRREVGRSGNRWPLFRIGPDGRPERLGELHALHGDRQCWYLQADRPLPLYMHGEFASGFYDDLPWFLMALRPQGYLGREFLRRYGDTINAPHDLQVWQADDVLLTLFLYGTNLSGDLIIGDQALHKAMPLAAHNKITPIERLTLYPQAAKYADRNGPPGSSAAGEQPKFISILAHPGGELEEVIVKFARIDPDNAATRRWGNLLLCEEQALRLLAEHGIASAQTEIVDVDDWRFLQSTRFDRTPQGGRIGVIALDALDAAYGGGVGNLWLPNVIELHRQGFIDADDLERIRLLDAFGRLIGNTDMHGGNLSFFVDRDSRVVRLAPVYDMLPMHYRPNESGSVHDQPFNLPVPDLGAITAWAHAATLATAYWRRCADDARIGERFRALCADNARRIDDWRNRFGI
ncbi:MAG: type II toxin-antitoxin system HipA family toxin YjjJ [Lysobacteraceae bacterium]|nr:MAG: type II toxin-antitoxin system HipA family toxin YjjJ [Xanthomonadaceae bacterium]